MQICIRFMTGKCIHMFSCCANSTNTDTHNQHNSVRLRASPNDMFTYSLVGIYVFAGICSISIQPDPSLSEWHPFTICSGTLPYVDNWCVPHPCLLYLAHSLASVIAHQANANVHTNKSIFVHACVFGTQLNGMPNKIKTCAHACVSAL